MASSCADFFFLNTSHSVSYRFRQSGVVLKKKTANEYLEVQSVEGSSINTDCV